MSSHTGTPQYDLQIVLPQNLKEKLNLHHCSAASGAHLGVAKTSSKLRRTFYWVRISTDTEEYIQSCHVCASTKCSHVRICPNFHPHDIPHTPFTKLGIDHIGPVSKSGTAGYRYIAVCTDYFSRYVPLWPTTELTAETFAKEFFENVVCVCTVPQERLCLMTAHASAQSSLLLYYFMSIIWDQEYVWRSLCQSVPRWRRETKPKHSVNLESLR